VARAGGLFRYILVVLDGLVQPLMTFFPFTLPGFHFLKFFNLLIG
jgi:hypothetical protein